MKIIKNLILLPCLTILFACGGGGSGGTKLATDACSAISLPDKNLKIINGHACGSLFNSPIVRVVMYDASGEPLGLCTGTMLSSRDVLTAAHCDVAGTAFAAIFYGDPGAAKSVSVSRIKRHPGYVPVTSSGNTGAAFNDLAIYTLTESINLPVLPIATSKPLESGDVIDIFGYGEDENGTLDFQELKSGQMLVASVTENHISTFFDGDGSNTCQGDSGGPALIDVNGLSGLVGVTSTGTKEKCVKGDNSLFINLQGPQALQFILDTVPSAGRI